MVIKALTNKEVSDDWNYSEKLNANPLTVKTSWPHKEGKWYGLILQYSSHSRVYYIMQPSHLLNSLLNTIGLGEIKWTRSFF